MNNNQLNTADQLALRIIFNREASQLLDALVERLNQQGVIPLFINGEAPMQQHGALFFCAISKIIDILPFKAFCDIILVRTFCLSL